MRYWKGVKVKISWAHHHNAHIGTQHINTARGSRHQALTDIDGTVEPRQRETERRPFMRQSSCRARPCDCREQRLRLTRKQADVGALRKLVQSVPYGRTHSFQTLLGWSHGQTLHSNCERACAPAASENMIRHRGGRCSGHAMLVHLSGWDRARTRSSPAFLDSSRLSELYRSERGMYRIALAR